MIYIVFLPLDTGGKLIIYQGDDLEEAWKTINSMPLGVDAEMETCPMEVAWFDGQDEYRPWKDMEHWKQSWGTRHE